MQSKQTIYQLYESNIGMLVPMIAESLKIAEKRYPMLWIERAFKIAVERNARNWKYVEAILKRWEVEGFAKEKNMPARRDTEEARKKYGEWER